MLQLHTEIEALLSAFPRPLYVFLNGCQQKSPSLIYPQFFERLWLAEYGAIHSEHTSLSATTERGMVQIMIEDNSSRDWSQSLCCRETPWVVHQKAHVNN